MTRPIVIAANQGEVIGDAPDRRVEILSDDDSLHATWSRFASGRDGADLHVHHHHTDCFYVLEGELTLRLGVEGETVAVPAGTFALVPPDVVHGFRNDSDADMRYLNLHAPGMGFASFMRGLRDGRPVAYDQHEPPAGGGRPTSNAVVGDARTTDVGAIVHADLEPITVIESRLDAGTAASWSRAATHVHSYFVLDGAVTLTVGDDAATGAQTGAWLQVPAGVAHSVSTDAGARYLSVQTPRVPAA